MADTGNQLFPSRDAVESIKEEDWCVVGGSSPTSSPEGG